MSPPVRLALLGFTSFESEQIRATLDAGAGAVGGVSYVQAEDLASSSLSVVNADHEASVAEVRRQRRLATAVVLGTTPCAGAAAQLGRAFNAVVLRRTLDTLAGASPPVSEAVQRVQRDLARLGGSRFARAPAAPRESASRAMPLIQGPAAPAAPAPRTAALVVDESDLLLRQLHALLQDQDQGWDWQLARSAPEALECVATRLPRWVFVRTGLDSIDGFHTCRMARLGNRPAHLQPLVVLVLPQEGAVDRLRAQLAGADAVLTQPLNATALRELLSSAAAAAASPQAAPQAGPKAQSDWHDRALQ